MLKPCRRLIEPALHGFLLELAALLVWAGLRDLPAHSEAEIRKQREARKKCVSAHPLHPTMLACHE